MKNILHCYVSGRVQGVCFRMETQRQALLLGMTGWVRNLRDGRVEVLACGEQAQLDQLSVWLKKGPELARVLKVDFQEVDAGQAEQMLEEFDSFTIR